MQITKYDDTGSRVSTRMVPVCLMPMSWFSTIMGRSGGILASEKPASSKLRKANCFQALLCFANRFQALLYQNHRLLHFDGEF